MNKKVSVRHQCDFCDKTMCRKINDHILSCVDSNMSKGSVTNYLLLLSGQYNTFLYLLVPTSFNLKSFAEYINDIWMNCGCSHFFKFESEHCNEYKLKTKVKDVEFPCIYEYDMGSTTTIFIERLDSFKLCNKNIELCMRNTQQDLACSSKSCNNYVESFCVECDKPYCKKCVKKIEKHECCDGNKNDFYENFDTMILPYLNSPRTFTCNYTGEVY